MATALRPDSRRVAEATPAAMTAAFLFEAAVCAASWTGVGAGAAAGGASSAAASTDGGDKGDGAGGGLVSAAASRKKKRPRISPSTEALSHSLALAAGMLSRSSVAPLPRGASQALCSRCGKVLGAGGGKDESAVRPLSRSCRRRRRRAAVAATAAAAVAAGATEPSSSRRGRNASAAASSKEPNTVVLVVTCGACGQAKRARGFYTRELAEAAAAALRRGGGGAGGGGGG